MSRAKTSPPAPGSYNYVLRSLRFDPKHRRRYSCHRENAQTYCLTWRGRKKRGGGFEDAVPQMFVFLRYPESRGRILKMGDRFEDVTDQWAADLQAAEQGQESPQTGSSKVVIRTPDAPQPGSTPPPGPPLARNLDPCTLSVRVLEDLLIKDEDRDRYDAHLERYLEMEEARKPAARALALRHIKRAIRLRDADAEPASPPEPEEPSAPTEEPDAPAEPAEPEGEPASPPDGEQQPSAQTAA